MIGALEVREITPTYANKQWNTIRSSSSVRERNVHKIMPSERVVFSFDPPSLETLNQVKERGDFPSLGMAVRESVQLNDFFQNLVDKGFSEIVVRNPESQQEKTIVISSLERLANKKSRAKAK